jgi:hypothetical protein
LQSVEEAATLGQVLSLSSDAPKRGRIPVVSKSIWRSGVFIALALSACQAKTGGDAKRDAAPAAASGCHAYEAGKDNVIRTFCDGPGVATFVMGSTSCKLGGGACEPMGQMFSFNAGVVVTPGPGAPTPDYVGLSVTKTGDFTGGVLAITYAGKRWSSAEIHGNVTAKGGTFEGPIHAAVSSDHPDHLVVVKGSFTC